jgi:hypothetical protein
MTLMARKSDDGKSVVVRTTYGPITNEVTEDPGHLRSFWGELGRLLREIEHGPDAPEPAQLAFEAYARHANGANVFGGDIPPWDEAGDDVQEHWRAALAEPGVV